MLDTRRTRWLFAVGVAVLWLAALDVGADEGSGGDAIDWNARAKDAWRDTCQKCHTATDSTFETDRGFLAQIMETT